MAHLDRSFDYLVSEADSASVRPGVRVRVRFAGRLVDAYVTARAPASEHAGTLSMIQRVVSPEVVLTPEVRTLVRAVADRWAGTFSDVVRLAVPPRHARAEKTEPGPPAPYAEPSDLDGWAAYATGSSYLGALRRGDPARAVWTARAGEDWPLRLAEAAAVAATAGRGVILAVPDLRDAARVEQALRTTVGDGFVLLTAELGPEARYKRFLRLTRGEVRIALGTRSAVFAPVADLGLIAVWDDGDDLYDEPRAPYPNARDVAVLRAHQAGAAALVGGFGESVAAAALVERGWAHTLAPDRAGVRASSPRILASGDDNLLGRDEATRSARLPSVAIQAARAAIARDQPVLVQVPHRGYAPVLRCERCREPARCEHCHGPLGQAGPDRVAACRWCGQPAARWRCPTCGAGRFRASVIGSTRTAEELGRAVPGARVVQSTGAARVDTIEAGPTLVVCTPGAEPVAVGGYGAALLLDGWALLSRADLRAGEEALRRWMNAAGLVRPADEGGQVVVMAEAALPVVQSLIRWDARGLAERELEERRELRFPPTVRMAALSGTPASTAAALEAATLPASAEILGPVPDPDDHEAERYLIRTSLADGAALATALADVRGVRSARKATDRLQIRLDPPQLL